VCLAVLLTAVPRTVPRMIRGRSLSPIFSCIKIIRFAVRCLVSPRRPGEDPNLVS
jgi:hypothetical protein